MATKKLDFEGSLARLEEIVSLLEKGEAPLSDSLKLFEEGTGLLTNCSSILDKAEQLVVKLQKNSEGKVIEMPFEELED